MEDESHFINDLQIYTKDLAPNPSPYSKATNHVFISLNLNLFLYNKYSSSQNYYYTKEVNGILGGSKTSAVIEFNDLMCFYEEEHLLKRIYKTEEYPQKISLLAEYYKYHEDVPRLFMMPVAPVVHNYYDKKRRINYIRITRLLREENPDMTNSHNLSNINIHDSDTSLSFDNNETIPKSLYKLLPDEMTPKGDIDLDETSGRKYKMTSSVTVYDLTDILSDIFKKSGKLLEKRKIKGKVLKYSKLESDNTFSFELTDLQKWSSRQIDGTDLDHAPDEYRKLFLSDKVNKYIAGKNALKHINPETTKHGKKFSQIKIGEPQTGIFKKKKEPVQEFKNNKLSQLKSEDVLKKLAAKTVDVKNLVKKGTNFRFILNTEKLKEIKDERKDKISNLNINNLNININFNGTNNSNRLHPAKKTGSVGCNVKPEKGPGSLVAESPSYSLLKNQKMESNRDRETRGRSINFTQLRNWNGSNENNLNTRTLDKNIRIGDFSSKIKDSDGLINLSNFRKSFKSKPNFATFYLNKQSSTIQALKSSEFFKSKEPKDHEPKNVALYKARLLKANSPTTKDHAKIYREASKEAKISQRRQKSKTSVLNNNNQIKLFMSQDYKENRLKISTASKSIKNTKSVKINKKDRSPIEKQKQTLRDLLEDGGIYNKFSTFGASFKGRIEESGSNPQFNTVTHVNLFKNKKSRSNNAIKLNIENSIKG